MRFKAILLFTILSVLAASPAFGASAGVHLHNQPGTTKTSDGLLANIQNPRSTDKLVSVTVAGYLQPGDKAWIVTQSYDQFFQNPYNKTQYISKHEITNVSFPYTYNPNSFRCWLEVTTGGSSNDCTLLYFTRLESNYGSVVNLDPLKCDSAGSVDPPPPPDPPDPPPPLPPPPSMSPAPSFDFTQPSLPSGNISIPSSGSFDGSYVYQEPEREGAFTYTPPPLDVPDPIPSPPPPPAGPGLFNFGSIMQTVGTPEPQGEINQPGEKDPAKTKDNPLGMDAAAPVAPSAPSAPVNKNNPKNISTPKPENNPKPINNPKNVDIPKNETSPIPTNPELQPSTPLPVQNAEVQPAIMDAVKGADHPLTPDDPIGQN